MFATVMFVGLVGRIHHVIRLGSSRKGFGDERMTMSGLLGFRGLVVAASALALSACVAPRVSQTDFSKGVGQAASQVANWSLGDVQVAISNSLTVTQSPSRRYPPTTELVWYGDPPGDRKAQVETLMADAVRAGAADALVGSQPVTISLNITEFHAMTPRARATELQLGVHEIMFDISVIDSSGATIASETGVRADLQAFSGASAVQAEKLGQGQKIRIQSRVAQVIRAWLVAAGV